MPAFTLLWKCRTFRKILVQVTQKSVSHSVLSGWLSQINDKVCFGHSCRNIVKSKLIQNKFLKKQTSEWVLARNIKGLQKHEGHVAFQLPESVLVLCEYLGRKEGFGQAGGKGVGELLLALGIEAGSMASTFEAGLESWSKVQVQVQVMSLWNTCAVLQGGRCSC